MAVAPGLTLPAYFSYYDSPVKLVETADGGVAAWRMSIDTGGWEPVNNLIDKIIFAVGGEVDEVSREAFVQHTERDRGRYLNGEGPIFALYETVRAIVAAEKEEGRFLTGEERALVRGIRRKTFRMFEEKLQQEGDPAADPSLAG
jgi:hypothetical protein